MGWLLKLFTGNPLVMLWVAGAIFLAGVASGGSGAWWVQGLRLETANSRTVVVQGKYDAFVSEVKLTGERMRDHAIQQAKIDKAKKEKIDAQNKTAHARDAATIAQLRLDSSERERRRGGVVPRTPGPTGSPDVATFDRPLLERAIRSLVGGVRSLVDIGSAAVTDLDSAKDWAGDLTLKLDRDLKTP